jgi:hypothetical protein
MEKKKNIDPLQFDKRVMQRFVTNGKMTNKELESHLQHLPDLAEQCEDISEVVYEHFKDGEGNDHTQQ